MAWTNVSSVGLKNGNKGSNLTTNGFANLANNERQPDDYYATEPKTVEMLLEFGFPFKNVWENAVGGWHLANVLDERYLLGRASDLVIRRPDEQEISEDTLQTEVVDFLQYDHPNSWNGDI